MSTQSEPCWLVDLGDDSGIIHYPTKDEAEKAHPAVAARGETPCQVVRCSDCGVETHYHGDGAVSCWDCEEVLIAKAEHDLPDPDQEYLFDALTAPDDTGRTVGHLVLYQAVGAS